ncbi:hypothetical protein AB0G35_20725 [Streptomyces sp. NPDC021749]|uniref:hypothetical protein n=1 Tax=Streptomyces sp. NPDC021749 TaxID=3154905 RepID=UPI0033E5591C
MHSGTPTYTPTPTPTPTHTSHTHTSRTGTSRTGSSRTGSSRTPTTAVAAVAVALAAALGLTGCSVDAKSAKPESKRFPYTGTSLKLLTHEVATKLVATDRKDIKVTRWFDSAAGTVHLKWTLKGDTLDIDAGCSGLALCDARFTVEVPKGITVTKDGHRVLKARQSHQERQPGHAHQTVHTPQAAQPHQAIQARQAAQSHQIAQPHQAPQTHQIAQPHPSHPSSSHPNNEKN